MARSTRRRRSRGGDDKPFNTFKLVIKPEYKKQLSTKKTENVGMFPALLTPEIQNAIRAFKDSGDKSITSDSLPGVITFLDNVCLAMKTNYKATLASVKKDASYWGVGMSEGSDKKYEEISDKYREVFGNAENWFAGKKENVSLSDALSAWEFIYGIYQKTPRRQLTSNEIREGQVYVRNHSKGGSRRRRKTRKH